MAKAQAQKILGPARFHRASQLKYRLVRAQITHEFFGEPFAKGDCECVQMLFGRTRRHF
jgi:hypothetical protein